MKSSCRSATAGLHRSPSKTSRGWSPLLADPRPHIGRTYHLTGPQSQDMHFFAREYSEALGRTITYADIPVEAWRDGLLGRGLPLHLVNHLTTMADLHRSGRYDWLSDDVLILTGREPLSVQDVVGKNAATFSGATSPVPESTSAPHAPSARTSHAPAVPAGQVR